MAVMVADVVATHLQNFYLVCGTAIPVLFVALAVAPRVSPQYRQAMKLVINMAPFSTVRWVGHAMSLLLTAWVGLTVMLLGDAASLAALAFDVSNALLAAVAGAGVLAGAGFVSATVVETWAADSNNKEPAATSADEAK